MAEIVGLVVSLAGVIEPTGKLIKKVAGARHAKDEVIALKETLNVAKAFIGYTKKSFGDVKSNPCYLELATQTTSIYNRLENNISLLEIDVANIYKRKAHDTLRASKWKWLWNEPAIERRFRAVIADVQLLGSISSGLTLSTCMQLQAQLEELTLYVNNLALKTFQANKPITIASTPSSTLTMMHTSSFLYMLLLVFFNTRPHCSRRDCVICQRITIYYFHIVLPIWLFPSVILPTWLATRMIEGSIHYSQSRGPTLQYLRPACIRLNTDEIFLFLMLGELDMVKVLFTEGKASPWDTDEDGNTLLWYALSAFNTQMVGLCDFLKDCGVKPLTATTYTTATSRLSLTLKLAWRLITARKVDLSKRKKLGLFFDASAVRTNHTRNVRQDVSYGVEFELCSRQPDRSNILSEKYKYWDSWDVPIRVIKQDNDRDAPQLCSLEHFNTGINPDIDYNNYFTEAVLHHHDAAIPLLRDQTLLKGSDAMLNSQNAFGLVPLHYAIFHNQHRCIRPLLDAGADCSLTSLKGHNILHFAAGNADTETLELLVTAPKLSKFGSLSRPKVTAFEIAAIRRKLGINRYRPITAYWWAAWEKLVSRCAGREDNAWKSLMPEPDEGDWSEEDWQKSSLDTVVGEVFRRHIEDGRRDREDYLGLFGYRYGV